MFWVKCEGASHHQRTNNPDETPHTQSKDAFLDVLPLAEQHFETSLSCQCSPGTPHQLAEHLWKGFSTINRGQSSLTLSVTTRHPHPLPGFFLSLFLWQWFLFPPNGLGAATKGPSPSFISLLLCSDEKLSSRLKQSKWLTLFSFRPVNDLPPCDERKQLISPF